MKSLLSRLWRGIGRDDFHRTIQFSLLLAGIALALGGVMVWDLSDELPDLQRLREYEPRLTTRLLDREGEVLTELYTQRRLMVPLDRIPPVVIDAILTTEDRRFYDHWGVDIIRIVRAALVDITTLSLKQGASTITQQLARDLFLTRRQTVSRKVREILTAVQIERHYTKDEILEMYLTQIYFGHGAYGIAAAAWHYFGVPPDSLNLAQAALLAALPKAPNRYSPRINPELTLSRRNLILSMMKKERIISEGDYQRAAAEPIAVVEREESSPLGTGPYFTEMVRQRLSEEGRRLGFDYLSDGLIVHTTLDAKLQRCAEAAVREHIGEFQSVYRRRFVKRTFAEVAARMQPKHPSSPGGRSYITEERLLADSLRIDSLFFNRAVVQAAVVALDPHTGDILALIGGRDFNRSKFNRAVQAVRQPGSVFKPVAYTAAIDNGYPTSYQLLNQDVVLINPDGSRWVPANYDDSKGGPTTLREALRRSLNLVTVRLVQEVVPPSMVVKYAHQLGFTTPIQAVESVGLGATGVLPIDAAAAFAVFASGGIHSKPHAILAINDRFGDRIADYPPARSVALSPETAYIMTDLLRTALNNGTGASARWKYEFRANAAGKTGTTNDFTDAWFVGFTPDLVCAVWIGLDDPSESLGKGQSGAVAALPIWAKFMKMAYDSLGWEDKPFPKPAGVVELEICDDTKDIAAPWCPVKVAEIFRNDSRPTQNCRKHSGFKG